MGLVLTVWLLLLALVGGPVCSSSLVRRQRQASLWRQYVPFPAQGSFRGAHREVASRPLVGLGSLRGSSQNRRGQNAWFSGALPRQMQQLPLSSPISVQCTESELMVTVRRDFYGNGILVQPTELTLGTCQPSQKNATTIIFLNNIQDCGTLQMTSDYFNYVGVLHYKPLSNGVIIRSSPADVPINCIYARYGNVSSNAIQPTWAPFSTTVSTQENLHFSLTLMANDWIGPRNSSVFQLGQSLNIEASVNSENHMSLILYVDYCVATISPDINSSPNYEIIAAHGCFMDAMRDETTSAFRSPRIQSDKLQFSVEAFRFQNTDVSVLDVGSLLNEFQCNYECLDRSFKTHHRRSTAEIYITCNLRAVSASHTPDSMNKACSYNRESNSWSPVEGPSSICQCCFNGLCEQTLPPSRTWGHPGRPRGYWKRRVGHHSEAHGQAILGPILVTEAVGHVAPKTGLGPFSRTT